MVTTMPRIHIALMGMERLVRNLDDLALLLSLLPRSATAQKLSVYTQLVHKPLVHQQRRARERRRCRPCAGAQEGAQARRQQQPREHPAAMLALRLVVAGPPRKRTPLRMSTEQPAIQSVAVIGAGQMGAGIAQVAARAGLTVSLSDQAEAQATQAVAKMEARLRRQESDGKLPAGGASELLARIRTGGTLFGVAEADLVIEAAPEQLELKSALFRSLGSQAKPDAILASNTSSLSITRLARETNRPEQVIGMHFMNPVPVMKLVEVVRGTLTSDVTLSSVLELSKRLGKQSIVSQDRPGFLVNRILIPLLNEACFAL